MSIKSYYQNLKPIYHIPWSRRGQVLDRKIDTCPYCQSGEVVKRGRRQTKHETIQLYHCKSCHKTFTPKVLKSKQYPLKVIFDAKYGEWLGCHMIGAGVTDMIAEAVLGRKLETTGHEVLKAVHPHPTMSEAVMEAVADAYDEVIHL